MEWLKRAPTETMSLESSSPFLLRLVSLNIACLNVCGIGSKLKHMCIFGLRTHSTNVMVTTETKLNNPRAFSQHLINYEKIMSSCWSSGSGGVVVLFRKSVALELSTIFIDPESKLAVFEVTYHGKSFMSVAVYAS